MAEPAEDEATDAQVIVLRDPDSGDLLAEERNIENANKARLDAQKRKAIFEHREVGANARAAKLPRKITPAWAAGVTNLMLGKLLQEELVPANAKEAADIAKITHEIYKSAALQPDAKHATPEERRAKLEEIVKLDEVLAARAEAADAQTQGALAPGEPQAGPDNGSQWEHEQSG